MITTTQGAPTTTTAKPEEEQPSFGVQKPAQAPQATTTVDNMKQAGATAPQDLGQWANYQQGHDAAHTQATAPGTTTGVGASANQNTPRTTGVAGGFGIQPVSQQNQQWHPTDQGYASFGGPAPMMPSPQGPATRMPSVEEVGLQGGPQGVQNLMQALSRVGAGGNNNAMRALGNPTPGVPQGPFLGGPAAFTGGPGSAGYFGGFGGPEAQGGTTGGGTGSRLGNAITPGTSPLPGQPRIGAGGGGGMQAPQGLSGSGYGIPGMPAPYAPQGGMGNQEQVPSLLRGGAVVSDERAKTDVRPATGRLESFLDTIGPHEYSYKDPRDGAGRYVGPMAQELERTEIGRHAVIETPRGKMVNFDNLGGPGRTTGVLLAVAADFQRRLKAAGL